MCIRDRSYSVVFSRESASRIFLAVCRSNSAPWISSERKVCLLYTSDAADERSSVDLGGRRIIKKNKKKEHAHIMVKTKDIHKNNKVR